MATLTVYSKTSDGRIWSSSAVYATARTGFTISTNDTATTMNCGQSYSDPTYWCMEIFTQYDTSAIPDGDVIVSAKEELFLWSDSTLQDYTEEVREYDWGAALGDGDWVSGEDLGDLTLLSSKLVDPAAGYNIFPDSANFRAAINKAGDTRLMHNSDRHRIGNTPVGTEHVGWYSADQAGTDNDPKLTVEYEPPPPVLGNFLIFMFD